MSENHALTLVTDVTPKTLASIGPRIVEANQLSVANCNEAGIAILDAIEAKGMTDELDARAKVYLDKVRRTLKVMNERRSPITKIFDQIRSEFTTMENSVDPGKAGTIAYKIQQLRNTFAARKREEEERARREEMLRQQRESAIRSYTLAVEDNYKAQFNTMVIDAINRINRLDADLAPENYDATFNGLKGERTTLTDADFQKFRCTAIVPSGLSVQDCQDIQRKMLAMLAPQFIEQYAFEVGNTRDEILDRLPSKRKQLERASQASEAEAARIKAEMAAREADEARRREEDRLRREQEEKAKAELARQSSEMDSIFGAATLTPAGYSPKSSVKLKLVPQSAEAFMHIVSMWWSSEGQYLSVEELNKIFKKQVTFCEKLANDKANPTEISHPSVLYVEEIKAR